MFDSSSSRDYRLVLPGIGAWLAAWGLTTEQPKTMAFVVLLTVIGCLIGYRFRIWVVVAASFAMVGVTLIGATQLHLMRSGLLAELSEDRAIVEVEFVVSAEPRTFAAGNRASYAVAPIKLHVVRSRGVAHRMLQRAELTATGEQALTVNQVGARYRAWVRLDSPEPGERLATSARLKGEPTMLSPPGAIDRFANRLRMGLSDAMRFNSPDQAALVPSLVVGDTSKLRPELTEAFKKTGLTHLTAVSGSNLTLLLAFVGSLLSWVGIHGWSLRFAKYLVVPFFVLLCRSEPSVVRAAAMGLVALTATGASPNSSAIRNLSLAVLVLLLVDPWLSRSWGFAMSVSASVGILILGSRWQRKMREWAPGWLAEALCIPLAAQLATQPLVTALSGTVSLAAVSANALSGPFVGPVTVLGILAAVISLASALISGAIGFIAGVFVQPIISLATWLSSLPAANWDWASTMTSVAVLIVVCIIVGAVADLALGRPLGAVLLFGTLIAASFVRPVPVGWPGDWSLAVCDVGQGSAAVLQAAPGVGILVDAGPPGDATVECLRSLRINQLALVVISHAHSDHLAGLPDVLAEYQVGQIASSDPAGVEQFLLRRGLDRSVSPMWMGTQFQLGNVAWMTLAPKEVTKGDVTFSNSLGDESSVENDSSIVARAVVNGISVLLTGDVEPEGQQKIIDTGVPVEADVLVIPHHGSSRQDETFFVRTIASVAVASVGAKNEYGHPAVKTIDLAESLNMRVFRTDEDGSVAISRAESGALNVRTYR